MEISLAQAIHASLKDHVYHNAVLLAERLYAERQDEEAAHLLATAHFHLDHHPAVVGLLRGRTEPKNRSFVRVT